MHIVDKISDAIKDNIVDVPSSNETVYWTDISDDNILDINGDPIEVIG